MLEDIVCFLANIILNCIQDIQGYWYHFHIFVVSFDFNWGIIQQVKFFFWQRADVNFW